MTRTVKASLLLFFFSLCASAIVVTHQVRLQVPAPVPHQLFAVVEQQLAAFRAADYSSAYRQAASDVQQKFTAPQYEAMIRRDYGHISGAQRIEFGFVKVNGPTAVVQVFFCDANGLIRPFLYSLTAEGNSWKINGVQPMRSGPRPAGLHI
jgi:hypothetical protein